MPNAQLSLDARHDLTPAEIDEIEDRFYELNAARTGCRDYVQLGFVLSAGDREIGVVAGYTWGGICEIRQLWIDEDFRGHGHGSSLMWQAIDEARARGCELVYLATYSFQAPLFYEKLGFRRAAAIGNKPLGHTDIIMCLDLSTPLSSIPLEIAER